MRRPAANRKGSRDREASARRGAVLIASLVIVVMLCAVLLEFNFETRLAFDAADNGRRSLQALYCAEAGLNACIAGLRVVGDERGNSSGEFRLRRGFQ